MFSFPSQSYCWLFCGRLSFGSLGYSSPPFADDTIIFCDNECEHIINLHCILVWFEAVSGMSVNLSKSSILPVGEVDNAHVLAGILGCGLDPLLSWTSPLR